MSLKKRNSGENVFKNSGSPFSSKVMFSDPQNEFVEILHLSGFRIGRKNDPNELDVDQAVFVRDLTKFLVNKNNSSKIAPFMKGFEDHLEIEERLKWSLMPTITSPACKTARNACQDSLAHILLGIEVIQEKVSKLLLEKLVEYSVCENEFLFDRSEGKSVACMIVSQYRWLNKLVDGKKLAEQLIELIKATPTEVQKDIIILLPDVINEFDHPTVAFSLSKILADFQDLNITILSTLSNLNIESTVLKDIRKQVLQTVSTANIEDLPVIVKFVLLNLSDSETVETICKLRENLDFTSTFNPVLVSTPIQPSDSNSEEMGDLVLNAIKLSLKFQKGLRDAWFKFIEQLKTTDNHKSIDIMVLLILLSLGLNVKKIESLIKSKIKCGDINEDLLHVTFRCHHRILREYFPMLLKLAEILLCSSLSVISSVGCSLYIKVFIWFDSYSKQEVVGNLVTHVGKNSENERNAALDTLLSLVRNHTHKTVPFGLLIKNLLDHLDKLTLNQIKKVYAMLGILSFQGGREGAFLQNDLFIVIRKQLTNGNVRYKKMGVIGALMIARTSCASSEDDSESVVSEPNLENEQGNNRSVALLELIYKSTIESPDAYALFCDELSRTISEGKLGKNIQDWIDLNILSEFEEMFITDVKPDTEFDDGISPRFSLDTVEEPVAINLYNIVKNYTDKSSSKKKIDVKENTLQCSKKSNKSLQDKDVDRFLTALLKMPSPQSNASGSGERSNNLTLASPLKLAPLFRLLKTQRVVHHGSLDAIDALLGCPVMLPELKVKFFMIPMQRKHLFLNVLFYFMNWIRETINAFAIVNDKHIKINLCNRLMLLVELQELTCKYVFEAKVFVPPPANFDCEEHEISQLKLPIQKSVKRKKSKNTKSKKAKTDPTQLTLEMSQNHTLQINSTIPQDVDSDVEEVVQETELSIDSAILPLLRPFFRELDLDVFSAFEWGISFDINSDPFAPEKRNVVALHPKELHFLLEDLAVKLHNVFNFAAHHFKPAQKRIGFSNLESHSPLKIITVCMHLLPSLCKLAEKCCSYYKNLREESDGIIDSLSLLSKDSQLIARNMQLIFKVIASILSWKDFNLLANAELLKKALKIISSLGDAPPDHMNMAELIKSTELYFMNYANDMPSLSCAATFVQLLVSPLQYTKDEKPRSYVSAIALRFLKNKWIEFDSLKTTEANQYIQILLEAYISNSHPVLDSLEYLAGDAIPEFINDQNEDSAITFNTLRKSSLHCYYKIMLNNLATYMKMYYFKKSSDVDEELVQWLRAIKVFQVLTNLIKTFEGRVIIGSCLKYGRQLLDTFLKHGMPLLDTSFKSKREDVIRLLKTLQMSTRYLQHVCSHSKVLKDVSLTRQVPFLKKSLEILVYRVKMMLAVNRCEEAFWVGNLKNRDIKGVEILSQEIPDVSNTNDVSDEENPSENLSDPSIASDSDND